MKAYLRPSMWRFGLRMLRTWIAMPRRLERLPLGDLLADLDRPRRDRMSTIDAEDVRDTVHFLLYRLRVPVRNTCLVRCLTVYLCMRTVGLDAHIVFAVRPGQSIEDGHCWLEHQGQPFLEPDARRHGFTPIFRHPDPDHAAPSNL